MKSLIKFFLIIGWMILINSFSSQVGAESSKTSGFVVSLLTSIGIDLNSLFGQFAHLVVRKAAHMFVYFSLFLLFYHFIKDYLSLHLNLIYSFCFSFVYACLDEYHQTFVPMRAGSLVDVGVDMVGVLVAILLLFVLRSIRLKWNKLFPTKS